MERTEETGSTRNRIAPGCRPDGARQRPSLAEALANPAAFYASPRDLASDPELWPDEKRALLLSWARDALAIEQLAMGGFSEIAAQSRAEAVIDALKRLDPHAADEYRSALAAIRGERRQRRLRRRAAQ